MLIFKIYKMSRNTDENKKKHKKKLNQKKRKAQEAEAERKARLKTINQQFNDQKTSETEK